MKTLKTTLSLAALFAAPMVVNATPCEVSASIQMQEVSPADREAVLQLLKDFQSACIQPNETPTLAKTRESFQKIAGLNTTLCPYNVQTAFSALANAAVAHLSVLEKVVSAAGLSENDDLSVLENDPTAKAALDESAKAVQSGIIQFVMACAPYLKMMPASPVPHQITE